MVSKIVETSVSGKEVGTHRFLCGGCILFLGASNEGLQGLVELRHKFRHFLSFDKSSYTF